MLIHLVSDEFLELELDLRSERLRLAHALGLTRMDLTGCKVFVTFDAQPLDSEKLHAKFTRTAARAGNESLELYDHGQIDWLTDAGQGARCDDGESHPVHGDHEES